EPIHLDAKMQSIWMNATSVNFIFALLLFIENGHKLNCQDCVASANPDCVEHRDSKYRTYDGSCNHLSPGRERWGKAYECYERMETADYGDGQGDEVRKAKNGELLPNPR